MELYVLYSTYHRLFVRRNNLRPDFRNVLSIGKTKKIENKIENNVNQKFLINERETEYKYTINRKMKSFLMISKIE